MKVPRIVRLSTAVAVVLALSSCSKSPLNAPATVVQSPVFESSGQPASATSISPDSAFYSQDIDGAEGGSITYGSFRVDIPAGAFRGKATITVAQPDPTILKCDLSISPASANKFLVPVTLSAKLPDSSALADQMMWFDTSVLGWRLLPTVSDSARLELHSQLWHFSQYGAGRAGW